MFSIDQVRFVSLIVDELTANGVMEPARLFESPYTDHGHVDIVFPNDLDAIVDILNDVKAHAVPGALRNRARGGDDGVSSSALRPDKVIRGMTVRLPAGLRALVCDGNSTVLPDATNSWSAAAPSPES